MASERSRKNGTQAAKTVYNFLKDMELKPREFPFESGLGYHVALDGPTTECVIRIFIDYERFHARFLYLDPVPEERRSEVMEFITRANFKIMTGNFELNPDDGALSYKSSIDFTYAELVEPLVRNAMLSAMDSIDVFSPYLEEVIDGSTALRSFNRAIANRAVAAQMV